MVVDAVVSATGKDHINVALMIQNPKSKSTFLKKSPIKSLQRQLQKIQQIGTTKVIAAITKAKLIVAITVYHRY